MFAIEMFDYDTTLDTRTLQAILQVSRRVMDDSVVFACPKKKNLIKFVSRLEFMTSGQLPNDEDLKEVGEQIFKV